MKDQSPAPVVTEPQADAKAKVAQMDANAIASLVAEVITLRAKVEGTESLPKLPVTNDDLNKAIAQLEADAKADLADTNPRSAPNLSLAGILKCRPDLTKEQSADWKKRKASMQKAYSDKHRELLASRKALFNRVARNKAALVSTTASQRKDGTYSRVALAVREPGKPRSKGKKAKPSQIAAHVPSAPNANPPAQVQ